MMNEPVSTIMTRNLITVQPHDSLNEVFSILRTKRIHHVPVKNEQDELVGLVTTYDLFKLGMTEAEVRDKQVKEVMTTQLATLGPNDKIGTAAEIFLEHLFHALPIVSEDKLVGIITTHDVLKYSYYKAYPSELRN